MPHKTGSAWGGVPGGGGGGVKPHLPPFIPGFLWNFGPREDPLEEGGGSQHPQAFPRHPHPPRGVPPALNWGCGRLPRGVGGDNTGLQSCCSAGTPRTPPGAAQPPLTCTAASHPPPLLCACTLGSVEFFIIIIIYIPPPTHSFPSFLYKARLCPRIQYVK